MQRHAPSLLTALLLLYVVRPAAVLANTRLAVIGDFGTDTEREADVARLVHNWQDQYQDLHIVAVGDANYPSGSRSTIDANVGKYYHQFMHPYSGQYGEGAPDRRNRFWPCPGNHDYGGDPRESRPPGDLTPYLEYMPVGGRRFYDARVGPVHLFSLDSDRYQNKLNGTTSSSQQAAWLRRGLAASTAPWRIVFFHHPPYSSGSHGSTLYMRWPFEVWGASAVLSGHDHSYERVTHAGGFPYFVNGMGGARTYGFQLRPVGASAIRHTGGGGAQLVDASDRHITFTFMTAKSHAVIDCYGAVLLQPLNASTALYANCSDLQALMDMIDRATATNDTATLQLLEQAQRAQYATRMASVAAQANDTQLARTGHVRHDHMPMFNTSDGTQCLPLHTLCRHSTLNTTCCQPYVCLPVTRRCGYLHNTTRHAHGNRASLNRNKDLDRFGW
uniref:Calcineurin-like phosphoesterase domain-containing protein n=1 Tax=Chlamydomonas leiostraca TaxID=1034604 RepID=A0A7S0S667_9CHLO|mmetsp:Transcript_7774/g.19305  ORF Transcript_7774/g.19305 Transcript_7774/m.19305 type:complete len:445 (+) Transcript_7774:110-1444(+)